MQSRARKVKKVESLYGPIEVYDNDRITRHFAAYGAHARPQVAMICDLLREGDVVVDAGAHVGSFSIPMANKIGAAGKIIAIEANPDTYAILSRNLERHGINANIHNAGVSSVSGQELNIEFSDSNNSGADSLIAHGEGPAIKTRTIDELVDAPISMIKIDVEGMELEAIKSAEVSIDTYRPMIFLEYAPHRQAERGASAEDFEKFFQARRYKVLLNLGAGQASTDLYEIAELGKIGDLWLMTDLLFVPEESDRLPQPIVAASSFKVRYFLTIQMLRYISGIPKRLLKSWRRAR